MEWYQTWLRIYASFPLVFPILMAVDAPHGRFNSSNSSSPYNNKTLGALRRLWTSPRLNINGTLAWMIMELPSPILLLRTYHSIFSLTDERTHYAFRILLGFWMVHYANRAIISPLRTPSRSPSHIIVPLAAVGFNTLNASLMGAYLGTLSRLAAGSKATFDAPAGFWLGMAGAVLGLAGNVWHDEILLRLRKDKPSSAKEEKKDGGEKKPRYSIPYGGLYRYVSYPNYLSEWFEWSSFAFAATSLASSISHLSPSSSLIISHLGLGSNGWYAPPILFVVAEVSEMLPRAIRGHAWYKEKFGDRYPSERRAVFPWIL